MGALVAIPGSASANQAPQNLGKAASLLPAAPVKTGFVVTVRRAIATTVTLTSSQNPAKKGNSVTFTATVTATGTNILPTGTVVFRDGSKDVGTAQLEGVAQATFSTSSLDVASHNVTAFYQGNASFDPSTSQVLIQKVEEIEKKEAKNDDDDDDDPAIVTHRDDNLERRCRHFRNDDEEGADEGGITTDQHSKAREDLRRRCHRFWHRQDNDFTTLIDRGIRRHVEGHYDRGGGHREFWDSRRHRWIPEHKEHYRKPHKHHKVHRPVVQHFAVTG
ncbi:Ig-like domain-containing protein [Sphaerisporangium sp. NPDC049002]|uniref:Ig-like domain-containing protein n=1 Tax=Sphaerisporangium sp. NPDC049002 TaxID=3155392 RepID=UPI0033D1B6E5